MNLKTLNRHHTVLACLAMAMALTRFHHAGTAFALPDASLAVFFLAGIYLKSARHFAALFALAAAIDYVAIAGFGVSGYCISPAYVFLIPTYGAMWLAGRWFSRQSPGAGFAYASRLALALAGSASVAFLLSNGSFFWFSGKLSSVGLMEYAQGLSGQYLPYLGGAVVYTLAGLGVGAVSRTLANLRMGRVDIP